jgi:pimeloyl-ACP methyl ester carboxylesterase
MRVAKSMIDPELRTAGALYKWLFRPSDARLVTVPGASLFLPLDEPGRVSEEIAHFVRSPGRA